MIDAAMARVGESFRRDEERLQRLKLALALYPNTTPQQTWEAIPMLFWYERITVEGLRELPYQDFLKTPYWVSVSDHMKSLTPYCALCTVISPLEVHHCTYEHLGNEWQHLEDLIVLCHGCHDWHSQKPQEYFG